MQKTKQNNELLITVIVTAVVVKMVYVYYTFNLVLFYLVICHFT